MIAPEPLPDVGTVDDCDPVELVLVSDYEALDPPEAGWDPTVHADAYAEDPLVDYRPGDVGALAPDRLTIREA